MSNGWLIFGGLLIAIALIVIAINEHMDSKKHNESEIEHEIELWRNALMRVIEKHKNEIEQFKKKINNYRLIETFEHHYDNINKLFSEYRDEYTMDKKTIFKNIQREIRLIQSDYQELLRISVAISMLMGENFNTDDYKLPPILDIEFDQYAQSVNTHMIAIVLRNITKAIRILEKIETFKYESSTITALVDDKDLGYIVFDIGNKDLNLQIEYKSMSLYDNRVFLLWQRARVNSNVDGLSRCVLNELEYLTSF